ncbi:hypothetical protein [Aureivirga sp. CE67]|uniref:hypothetical protein n=1 Tax=Aureivirga sp. CE67 TaxID=1788983 RepID=UPI0018C9C1D5|nr:hypothetical protein [Aureivirga sp. CE67]
MRKTITRISIFSILLASFAACKSTPKAVNQPGEVEIIVHCSGPDYYSTDKFIRGNSIGESSDMTLSKKKSRNNTLQELSSKISTTVKAVIDNYEKSVETASGEDIEKRYEALTREVINQNISGYRTICEKVTKTKEGKYKTYLAYEISIDNLINPLIKKLNKDEHIKVDYDYEKFKETFEEELKKQENR